MWRTVAASCVIVVLLNWDIMPRNELDNPFEAIANVVIEGIEVLVTEVPVRVLRRLMRLEKNSLRISSDIRHHLFDTTSSTPP